MRYNNYYNTEIKVTYKIEKKCKFRRFVTVEFLSQRMPLRTAVALLNFPYFIVETISPSEDTETFSIKSVQGKHTGVGIHKWAFERLCIEFDESWE